MTPERFERVNAVLDKRQPDLTVLMDEVNKPHNLSAIVRTCDAVGVGQIHATSPSRRTRWDMHTSGGSTRWVRVQKHARVEQAIAELREQGMQILATHLSARSCDFRSVDYTKPTCIIVGAEKFGVSAMASQLADQHIIIPMDGMVQSLNVSVASAIVLYEAERQRRNAGFYATPRLSAEQRHQCAVEYWHPRIAAFCHKHALPYPALREDGELAHIPGEMDLPDELDLELKPEDGMY